VLPGALDALLARPDTDRVLDVGGWAAPVNRADWVIDAMPYATRGVLMPDGFGPGPERFSAERWVTRDICGPEPWPFEDGYFAFAICTFTLEDVRDPVSVCAEMSRVARAGYIEVPSLLDELSWRNPEASGGPWLGHSHHRWLCTLEGDELVFLHKAHSLHTRRSVRVPQRWARQLSVEERVLAHSWEGRLAAREQPAIDDYPLAGLEAAVRGRFAPSAPQRAATTLADRARASMEYRLRRRHDGRRHSTGAR
jgi:hypothetical protein